MTEHLYIPRYTAVKIARSESEAMTAQGKTVLLKGLRHLSSDNARDMLTL